MIALILKDIYKQKQISNKHRRSEEFPVPKAERVEEDESD
jgi:hypothetical protein